MPTPGPSTATEAVSAIRVFSAFLYYYQREYHCYQHGEPHEKTAYRNDPPKQNSMVVFLTHLCTLLTTGRPASLAPAATGHICRDVAEATIVVSSNPSDPAEALTKPFHEIHIQPKGEFSMDDLLKLPDGLESAVADLHSYISDLLAAFRHLCSRPHILSRERSNMTLWVLLQCHRSFRHRVQRHKYIWEDAPWEVMKGWYPTPETQNAIGVEECCISTDGIAFILGVHGMPCDGRQSIPFNKATFPAWVRCLGMLLSTVEESVNAIKGFENEVASENHQFMRKANAVLMVVRYLLSFNGIQQVIACDQFTSHIRLDDYGQPEERPTGKEDTEAEADEIRDAQRTPEETKGEHTLRYLNSILAWHTAVNYVIGTLHKLYRENSSSRLELLLVQLRDRSKLARDDVEVSGKSILKDAYKDKTWHDWVDEHFPNILPSHFRVHAEAGCMALYEYSKQPGCSLSPDALHALRTDMLPIGTSKECCHICYLLKDCLHNTTQTKVFLGKTHDRVLPWDPPEFGIAPETLAKLAKRLRDEVTAIARGIVQAAEENHTPHSPLGSGDLPLDDTRMDADEEYMIATGRL